jgi:hypothetical protein
MFPRFRVVTASFVAAALAAGSLAAAGLASAPPVGPLPNGPSSTIETQRGQLIAFALPHRTGGRVWRIARTFDGRVLHQVSEADVGSSVVLIFNATGRGTTTVAFGLTRGERSKAYESRTFTVRVR